MRGFESDNVPHNRGSVRVRVLFTVCDSSILTSYHIIMIVLRLGFHLPSAALDMTFYPTIVALLGLGFYLPYSSRCRQSP
jgi:hypothetical protein